MAVASLVFLVVEYLVIFFHKPGSIVVIIQQKFSISCRISLFSGLGMNWYHVCN